jgi:flagellar secretion chaperone FliS
MFGLMQGGANAYAKVGMETGVVAASPHKLIVMLFDGALVAVATALQHMKMGNIAGKGQAISKAISIIDGGLRESLDHKAGGEIAINLDALYEYMSNRLMLANLNNQEELLEEVQRLLQELRSAWEAIAPATGQAAMQAQAAAPDAPAPNIPGLVKA